MDLLHCTVNLDTLAKNTQYCQLIYLWYGDREKDLDSGLNFYGTGIDL